MRAIGTGRDPRVRASLKRGLAALLDLLYPPHCVACGAGGAWLCGACIQSIPYVGAVVCGHCGCALARPGLCGRCQSGTSCLAAVRSVAYHRSPLREAVHALKYEGLRKLAEPLADLLAAGWPYFAATIDVIVPVPLHVARLRQRGYNQALLLAKELGNRLGLPLETTCLKRSVDTRSQVGLSPAERWENVRDAFDCAADALRGVSVLLIDDVYTTGATLEACAWALLQAGVGEVWALTLVRAGSSLEDPLIDRSGRRDPAAEGRVPAPPWPE